MKQSLLLLLTLGSITAGCSAAPAPKVLLAQVSHTQELAQVKAGTLKVARASWWGFDKADATDCLQNAINSGVSKLIVDNTGNDWIINKPINLVSNQEIVFADGVVIQAKEDCFHGNNDSLFNGRSLTNLTVRGEGKAIVRMRKEDYQDAARYSRAEWRMGIDLEDCANVIIANFTITQTGGDGLYLGANENGYCKNVLVEDMNFDGNHRLGMAVISVENLTIRRCKFNSTLGTAPNGGLDFEPNFAGQRLVNCVVEDSQFTNNKSGPGIELYTIQLNSDSQPVSVSFKRCNIKGNMLGMKSTLSNPPAPSVKGNVTFSDCNFDHNYIALNNPTVNSAHYLFKNCIFNSSPTGETAIWNNTPITITTEPQFEKATIGGITFDNSTAIIGQEMQPIAVLPKSKVTAFDQIAGTLFLKQNGQTTPYNLAAFVTTQQKYWDEINALEPAVVNLAMLHAPDQDAARENNDNFYLQDAFTFLQYARQGQQITISLRVNQVYDRATEVELQDPNGKPLQTFTLPLDGKVFPITFTAGQTGLYRVVRKSTFSQKIDVNSSSRGTGLLADGKTAFLMPQGKIYFQVPVGVKSFKVGVSTDSTADVALLDSRGNKVESHNGVGALQLFSGKRNDASQNEIWSLDVSKAIWGVTVNLYEPLVPIVSTNRATLLLAGK